MKAQVKIEKIGKNGSRMVISAECDNITDLEEITSVCKRQTRDKFLGIF